MDKVHIFSQINIKNEGKKFISSMLIFQIAIAFLLGKVVFFDAVSSFGLAFLAAYMAKNKTATWKHIVFALFSLAGTAASGADISIIKYMLSFVLFALIYISVSTLSESEKDFPLPGIAAIAMLIAGIIFSAQTGFELYDVLMLLLECALCIVCSYLMYNAAGLVDGSFGLSRATGAELAGAALILILCVFGLCDFELGQFSIGDSLAAAIIMFAAISGGIYRSIACAAAIGVIFGTERFPVVEIVGVYSLCGLACGAAKRFGKAGVILGFFISNSILSTYLGGSISGVFEMPELFAAIILIAFTPNSVFAAAEAFLEAADNTASPNAVKFITQNLCEIGAAFSALAKTFSEVVHPGQNDNCADITALFDKTADKVCRKCGLKFICWEKQFNSTYDSIMKLVPQLTIRGKAETKDLGQPLRSKCIKSEEFIAELNKVYSQYKLTARLQQKAIETKELAAQQFSGMSKIITSLVDEINTAGKFDLRIEKRLILELENLGLKKCDATVLKNKFGRYEISLRFKKCAKQNNCTQNIIPVVSDITGRKMDKRSLICAREENTQRCVLHLCEKERFCVTCGVSSHAKDGQAQSGDNYNYMPICDGKYVIVLSDGMGSGKAAASQSKTAVTMLKQLLGAGFDWQSAVKIINSALLIKTDNECFATIDITILDLFDAEAEFIKTGANSTFIKHGKRVSQINSSTLPAGILKEVDVEKTSTRFFGGDYIIMLSDGVHGADDDWIKGYISSLGQLQAQAMADSIMEEALRRKNNVINDDMTVITARLLEI